MADLTLHDDEPEFSVERQDNGDVELMVRADRTTVRISIGRIYDSAATLAESLRHLSEDVSTDIVDGWEDYPDDNDAYISFDRARYHVSLEGTRVGDYLSRDVAEIELARAMVASGVFPNAWYLTDHGNHIDINDSIRGYHDEGGDGVAPLVGVQFEPGDRVWYAGMDWPHLVIGDWGPAGVEIHTDGDHTIRTHVTDRSELRPVED